MRWAFFAILFFVATTLLAVEPECAPSLVNEAHDDLRAARFFQAVQTVLVSHRIFDREGAVCHFLKPPFRRGTRIGVHCGVRSPKEPTRLYEFQVVYTEQGVALQRGTTTILLPEVYQREIQRVGSSLFRRDMERAVLRSILPAKYMSLPSELGVGHIEFLGVRIETDLRIWIDAHIRTGRSYGVRKWVELIRLPQGMKLMDAEARWSVWLPTEISAPILKRFSLLQGRLE